MDKLVSAETVDGGKLREAATRKADESILREIADKDAVALEVKYHKIIKSTRHFSDAVPTLQPWSSTNASMRNPLTFFVKIL